MRILLCFLFASLLLQGDEYAFEFEEPRSYEYGGYIRADDKAQSLRNTQEEFQNSLHVEALFNFGYYYDIFTFSASAMAYHDYIHDKTSDNEAKFNELYVQARPNANHTVLLGKKSLMWGKGYFFNPVAFFDREKDPSDPTLSREGFVISRYIYNKSFDSDLKNIAFELVYLPANKTLNEDFYMSNTNAKDSNNIAAKLYLLLFDTDIDLIFAYSDEADEKFGLDFSKNLDTNFEIHGEYANIIGGGDSHLLGLRYITDFELTVIAEYMYDSSGATKEQIEGMSVTAPFLAKRYAVASFTQKEPFGWLYSNVYYKNMLNLEDNSMQNRFGASYSFKNNTELDVSYNMNSGGDKSEFGKKQVKDFIWLRATLSF